MNPSPTHRSGLLVLSFQIEGLCTALRQIVPSGLPVGPETIIMVQRLKKTFDSVASGPSVEDLPNGDENSMPSDILMAVEVLRSTPLVFLSSEETNERKATLGFAQ